MGCYEPGHGVEGRTGFSFEAKRLAHPDRKKSAPFVLSCAVSRFRSRNAGIKIRSEEPAAAVYVCSWRGFSGPLLGAPQVRLSFIAGTVSFRVRRTESGIPRPFRYRALCGAICRGPLAVARRASSGARGAGGQAAGNGPCANLARADG